MHSDIQYILHTHTHTHTYIYKHTRTHIYKEMEPKQKQHPVVDILVTEANSDTVKSNIA